MPIFSFRNTETGEEYDMLMKYDDKIKYLSAHPEVSSIITGAPGLISTSGDRTKPPEGFKEVLSKIADANPSSALANDYGKKDHVSVKKREVVQKLANKITGGE